MDLEEDMGTCGVADFVVVADYAPCWTACSAEFRSIQLSWDINLRILAPGQTEQMPTWLLTSRGYQQGIQAGACPLARGWLNRA